MFIYFLADWQASAVDSLKTHYSNVYDELKRACRLNLIIDNSLLTEPYFAKMVH